MKESQPVNLESNDENTLVFIAMVNSMETADYKNIFDSTQNASSQELSRRREDIAEFNRLIMDANPAITEPLDLPALKQVILNTLNYIHGQGNNDQTKQVLENRVRLYVEDFSINQTQLSEQMNAIEPGHSKQQDNSQDSPSSNAGQKFHAYADKDYKLKYIHHVKSENGQEKTVWWARVRDDGGLSYIAPPTINRSEEIKNYKKVDFTVNLSADLPDKGRESVIRNGAREAIQATASLIAEAPKSSKPLPTPPPRVAAAKFPSTGPVASSAAKPVTASFEEKLFEYGGSLSKNTQGNFLYKHKDGGEITHDTNGIWRGTPAPPADDLGKQADHLVKDAIALITVDLASQKATNTNAPINLKMDGITNDDQRGALEAMVLQKIARKIQSDPSLKGITNPISVNGKTLPTLAKTVAIEPAAPAMSVERSAKKSWVPDRAPPKPPQIRPGK